MPKKKKIAKGKQKSAPQATPKYAKEATSVAEHFRGESPYKRYKRATQRFREGLRSLVKLPVGSVDELLDAVDKIAESALPVQQSIVSDLEFAIRIRQRVSRLFPVADEGHLYFIKALEYCRLQLKDLVVVADTAEGTTDDTKKNVFDVFFVDEVEDDGEEAGEQNEAAALPRRRPAPPPSLEDLEQELEDSDLRFQIMLYFSTLDALMRQVSNEYKGLKEAMMASSKCPMEAHLSELMRCTQVANTAMTFVNFLEQEFLCENPSFDTSYRMLAPLVFPKNIAQIHHLVVKHSRTKSSSTLTKDIQLLVGDIMDKAFRWEYPPTIKLRNQFCKKYKVNDLILEWPLRAIYYLSIWECPVFEQVAELPKFLIHTPKIYEVVGNGRPHKFLPHLEFVGGNNSIIQTVRLLQTWIPQYQPAMRFNATFAAKFRQWDDDTQLARYTSDLNVFLLRDFLPHYVDVCLFSLLGGKTMPLLHETMPLVQNIQHHLSIANEKEKFRIKKDKPIPFSLAFSIHCVLTALVQIQGNSHVHKLGAAAKKTFNRFYDQLEKISDKPGFDKVLGLEEAEKALTFGDVPDVMPAYIRQNGMLKRPESREPTLWNPLTAGMWLLHTSFLGNLTVGINSLDNFSQLKFILQLHHAFLREGVYKEGRILFLDQLLKYAGSVKSLFEGPLPEKGESCKRMMIAAGMPPKDAQRNLELLQNELKYLKDPKNKEKMLILAGSTAPHRFMVTLRAEMFLPSYRRCIKGDFDDVKSGLKRQRQPKDEIEIQEFQFWQEHISQGFCNDEIVSAMNIHFLLVEFLNFHLEQSFVDDEIFNDVRCLYKDADKITRDEMTNEKLRERTRICYQGYLRILLRMDMMEDGAIDPAVQVFADRVLAHFGKFGPRDYLYFVPMGWRKLILEQKAKESAADGDSRS